jgi:hypothetical protein
MLPFALSMSLLSGGSVHDEFLPGWALRSKVRSLLTKAIWRSHLDTGRWAFDVPHFVHHIDLLLNFLASPKLLFLEDAQFLRGGPILRSLGVVQRLIDLSRDPQAVQHYRELSGYRHYGAFSGILACCTPDHL